MYNLLVEKSFGIEQIGTVKLQDSGAVLKVYAGCLRANNLPLLEASLWACALRFVETSTDLLGTCGSLSEVSLYREELMSLVEEAERRCFGSSACLQAAHLGWEWEESMGCWLQHDLPPAKKAKRHHELEQRSSERRGRVVAADIQNEVMAGEDHHDYTSTFELSFASLLSNALSKRTKLHAESGQLFPSASRARALPFPHTKIYPSDDTIPTSDDALNLFTYTEIPS